MRDLDAGDLETMPFDKLADIRVWQLERLELVTGLLKQSVRDQAEQGVPISSIAKRSGITRPTLYKWIAE